MSTPCETDGECRPDCPRRYDDCDGNPELMSEDELEIKRVNAYLDRKEELRETRMMEILEGICKECKELRPLGQKGKCFVCMNKEGELNE